MTRSDASRSFLRLAVLAVGLMTARTAAEPGPPVLDETFQAQLDGQTNSRRDAGCGAELHVDGPTAYEAIRALIIAATDHVNVETLQFENDEHGREVVSLLADAALRGLDVNVIFDPISTQWLSAYDVTNFISEAGGHVRAYWPPGRRWLDGLNYRTHKKILLTDGSRVIVGGMNYGTIYFGAGQWRDTNLLLTGPVVGSIQEEFIRDWIDQDGWPDGTPDLTRYYPALEPTGPGDIRNVDQRPVVGDRDINRLYELLINRAERRVVIETPYFIPNRHVQDILSNAVSRGVEVTVLTNGKESNDVGALVFLPSSLTFGPMVDAGVQLYLWEAGAGRTMHAKALLIDDALAVMGGYNMSNRSYDWDTENVVVLTEPTQVGAVRDMLEQDFSRDWVVRVDRKWLNRVPLLDWVAAWFFSLFSWAL